MGDRAVRLVGRHAELRRVLDALADGRDVLVSGRAGVGKTRLLAEVAASLDGAATVISISGSSASAAVPLAPLLRLCPPGRPDPAHAILSELYRRSRQATVRLLVDDAHELDDASAALVHQLCGAGEVGLVVAVRLGEPAPPPIAAIWRDGLAEDVSLTALDRRRSDELVAELLGQVSLELAGHVWERCRGHPLFIRELLVSAVEDGTVVEVDGGWELVAEPQLPGRLRELLLRRLARLSDDQQRALSLVELAGGLDLAVGDELGLAGAVFELQARYLVVRDGSRVQVAHPLYGELALARLGSDQRRLRCRQLADALERAGTDAAVQAALLRLDAGDRPGPSQLQAALSAALERRQPVLAWRLAQAVETGVDWQLDRLQMHAAAMNEQWPTAQAAFEAARSAVHGAQRDTVLADWVRVNWDYRWDASVAVAVAERMLATPGISPETAEAIEAHMLWAKMFCADLAPTVADLEELAERPPRDPAVADQARFNLATALVHLLELRRSHLLQTDGLLDPGIAPSPVAQSRRHALDVWTITWLDGPNTATARGLGYLRAARAAADPDLELMAGIHLAISLHEAGRHADAVRTLHAVDHLRPYITDIRHHALTAGYFASTHAMLPSRRPTAEAVLAATSEPWERTHWVDGPLLWLARSRLDAAAGRSPHPALDAGLALARERSCAMYELQLLREQAHHGAATDVTGRVDQLATLADAPLATAVRDEVRALAAHDGTALHNAAINAARLGAIGLALDAATAAAAAHAHHGHPAQTLRAAALAAGLRGWLGEQTPTGTHSWESVLTDRERQVVDLVAAGASNPQVADTLHLSPRTIERHLYRIYRRLDLTSREELTQLVTNDLAELPIPTPIDL